MKKSTLVAASVFLMLVGAVIWSQGRKPQRGISRISFAEVDPGRITKVEIEGKNPVVLTKDGETWRVASGKEADANMVDRMVETISKIDTTDLVTHSTEKHAELEVDAEKGAHVMAYAAGKKVADLWVGKAAAGGSYVRVGDDVYIAKQVFASSFSREASAWLQRKLFDAKIADVTKVTVQLAGAEPYTLVNQDGAWDIEDASVLPKGFRFDKGRARSLASALVNARAKDILDAPPGPVDTKLGEGADVLAIFVEEGEGDAKSSSRMELRLGATNEEDKSVYAQVAGKEDVVTLAEYTAEALRKAPTDFRDLRVMDFEQDKVTEVSISAGNLRLVLEKQGADWKIARASEKIPEDFQLDPTMVTRRISALANARATEVAGGSKSAAGLTRPSATVTATIEGGKSVRLTFGKQTKDDNRDMVYASGNADGEVYLFTKWTRDNLTGGLDSFKKRAEPAGGGGLDPKALQNLPPDVRAGLMKQLQQKQQQQALIQQLQKQQAAKK